MRIKVQIEYLPNVEDPEALSIRRNLELTGYRGIKNVYSYKTYEFETTLDEKDRREAVRLFRIRLVSFSLSLVFIVGFFIFTYTGTPQGEVGPISL